MSKEVLFFIQFVQAQVKFGKFLLNVSSVTQTSVSHTRRSTSSRWAISVQIRLHIFYYDVRHTKGAQRFLSNSSPGGVYACPHVSQKPVGRSSAPRVTVHVLRYSLLEKCRQTFWVIVCWKFVRCRFGMFFCWTIAVAPHVVCLFVVADRKPPSRVFRMCAQWCFLLKSWQETFWVCFLVETRPSIQVRRI